MIIKKLLLKLANLFKKKEKRQNFLEPNSAEERNKKIRRLLAEKQTKKCYKCGKTNVNLNYDPVEHKYVCNDCWTEEDNA